MNLQSADRRHDDRRIRFEARRAAFDVEKALRAHVGAEARLGDQEVPAADADQVGDDRRVPGGDVPERARVHEDRGVLKRLQKIWFDRITQDDGHRTGG